MLRWCRADHGCSGAAAAQWCLSHWPLGENCLFLHPKEDLALPQWILQVFKGDTSLIPRLSRRCGSSVFSVTRSSAMEEKEMHLPNLGLLKEVMNWTHCVLEMEALFSYLFFQQHINEEKSFVKTKWKNERKWMLPWGDFFIGPEMDLMLGFVVISTIVGNCCDAMYKEKTYSEFNIKHA